MRCRVAGPGYELCFDGRSSSGCQNIQRMPAVCGRQAGKRVGGLTDGWSVQEKPFV